MALRIHALRAATVTIKESHRTARHTNIVRRYADILTDRQWTEPLPVWVWVIEHPEGVIVVDTGENIRYNDPDYLSARSKIMKSFLRLEITPQSEVGAGLQQLGIRAEDVRWVIQTHLHTDHAGGMRFFPKSEFLVAREEYVSQRKMPTGAVPERWDSWFNPTLIDYTDGAYENFTRSHKVTQAGDVILVPTHGHNPGHQSVIVQDGDRTIFIAGDASFDEDQVRRGQVAGIVYSYESAKRTLDEVRTFVQRTAVQRVPTVYLPSHDHGSADRLAGRVVTEM